MGRRKPIVLAVVVVALGVGALFLPVRDWFERSQGSVEALGPAGPFVICAIYALLTILLVPGSALTIGAGTLFGLWTGLGVVLAGANIGALGSFLLARTLLRDKVSRWATGHPRFAALDRAIAREGFKMVLLSRLSPVFPFTLLNYFLGLTAVRTPAYVAGNLIGMLPGTFLYVYIGATAREALTGRLTSDSTVAERALTVFGLATTVAVCVVVTRAARSAMAEAQRDGATTANPAQDGAHQ